jgi:hypothetical protein
MNYLKIYCSLIRKGLKRQDTEELIGYYEKHHVFPESIYGKNRFIVKLTAREHYIAHALLYKICRKRYGINNVKTHKMSLAFCLMNSRTNKNNYCNSHLFKLFREEFAKNRSEYQKEYCKNHTHPQAGKPLSEETKRKLSESLKGRKMTKRAIELIRMKNTGRKHSKEAIHKIKEARAKQVFTKEHIKKRGDSIKKLIWMHNPETGKQCRVREEQIKEKIAEGFIKGRSNFLSDEARKKLSLAAYRQWQKQKQLGDK